MNLKKLSVKQWIVLVVCFVLIAALVVGDVACAKWSSKITLLLCGDGINFEGEEVQNALQLGKNLVSDIMDEAIVMLKNDNNTLPLKDTKKVNLFGWASSDNGTIYSGTGSAACYISDKDRITLSAGLEASEFEVNKSLLNKYTAYQDGRKDSNLTPGGTTYLIEPDTGFYTDDVMNEAKAFSDTAIVTIARYGGEGYSIKMNQPKLNATNDNSRTYLQITTEEEALLKLVTENFEHVIVLLNCSNPMELGFIKDDRIDAVLHIGYLGVTGANAVGHVLRGTVNPSGHLTNSFAVNHKDDPAFANLAHNSDSVKNHMVYAEDIYVGYKWYETAFRDGYYGSKNYDEVVQFPFGFGMSYTTFDWNLDSVKIGETDLLTAGGMVDVTNKKNSVSVDVTVTNTGDYAGKDVVQLFYTAPYTKGGIEKAYVNLVAFDKTEILQPGQSQKLTLTFDLYDMASYDCYDRNNNGVKSYELDSGEYVLKLMTDSHTLKGCDNDQVSFNVPNTLNYKRDTTTKKVVKNRFTGDTAYAGVPIDGSTVGDGVTYLSRADFAGTFPTAQTILNISDPKVVAAETYRYDGYDNMDMPTQGASGDLLLWTKADGGKASASDLVRTGTEWSTLKENEDLMRQLVSEYTINGESETWTKLLNQISVDSLCSLVEKSGFINCAMPEIGKKAYYDYDGPSGFQSHYGSIAPNDNWTGYPMSLNIGYTWNKRLAFQQGRALAKEGLATGINGIYAPGANILRNPYSGRYYEYYSEDPVVTGWMAGNFIAGAKTNNMYCFMKHFVAFEGETNCISCWETEQALREVYLKPFEIAIKKCGANALMSSFNKLGGVWAGSNKALLTDILRNEWGFKGIVLTDYTSGLTFFNTPRAVVAGQDMFLCDRESNSSPLDRTNRAQMYAARKAAKNMIYVQCETYLSYKDYTGSDIYTAVLGTGSVSKVFPWWIPLLVLLNVAIVGLAAWQICSAFLPKKQKKSEDEVDTTANR